MATASKSQNPVRFRAARSDASIASISKRIARDYQLPYGSVKLVSPSGQEFDDEQKVEELLAQWAKIA